MLRIATSWLLLALVASGPLAAEVQVFEGTLTVRATSGGGCTGQEIGKVLSMTLLLDDRGLNASPRFLGYFGGPDLTSGRIEGAAMAALDVVYPYAEETLAKGHKLQLARSGAGLSGVLREQHLEADQRQRCNLDLADLRLALVLSDKGPTWEAAASDFEYQQLDCLASMYEEQGEFTKALAPTQRMLLLSENNQGLEHPSTGICLNHLAFLYRELGDLAKALPLSIRALAIQEKAQGPEDPSLCPILNGLVCLYYNLGEFEKALRLGQRSLSLAEKAGGADLLPMAECLNNLGWVHQAMGDPGKALPLYQRALAIREQVLGQNHPLTAASMASLGNIYQGTGAFEKALPLYTQGLAISEQVNGPFHPATGIHLTMLAGHYESQGAFAKALPLYARALAISEKVNGPDHPATGTSLNNLGKLYRAMGNPAKALPLCVRALEISEKANGPEHPLTSTCLEALAGLYADQGAYAKALPLMTRALQILETRNGPDHPSTCSSLGSLAGLYAAMGDFDQALPLFQRALAISEKAEGPDALATAGMRMGLGIVHLVRGEYAKGLPLCQQALDSVERANASGQPLAGLSMCFLALQYRAIGANPEALSLSQRALAIAEKANGPEHPATGFCLNFLAGQYQALGEYTKAMPFSERALAISEAINGPDSPSTLNCLGSLAGIHHAMGEYAKALPLYQRALAIAEKISGPNNPLVAVQLANLGRLHQDLEEPAKARSLYLRALTIAFQTRVPHLLVAVQSNLCSFEAKAFPAKAIYFGKSAINTLQALRTGMTSMDKNLQKAFLAENEAVYSFVADLLIQEGRLPEAQQVLAMLKEDELHTFTRQEAGQDPRTTKADLTPLEAGLEASYQGFGNRFAALGKELGALEQKIKVGLSQAEEARRKALEGDLAVARKAFDAFLVQLDKDFMAQARSDIRKVEYGGMLLNQLRSLQGTLQELGHGAVLLHYVVTKERVAIILTTPEVQLAREGRIAEAELNRKIAAFRQALQDPKCDPVPLAQELYRLLLTPVAEDLKQAGAQTLMLGLDGALRYLPFAALHDGTGYVAERFETALYTEVARGNLEKRPNAEWSVAGLGLTRKIEAFPALLGVKEELEGIVINKAGSGGKQGILPGVVKLDQAFTEDAFRTSLAQDFPVLHLASHFVMRPGTEADSFLLLGDGKRLTVQAVREGRLRFGKTDLVTLSACETAVPGGKDINGREIEGFGAVVQLLGAKGVLATLWPVADTSTGQLMQTFYRLHQENHLTKAEALRQAQMAFIHRGGGQEGTASRGVMAETVADARGAKPPYAHPYFWAPFILMGNWK